MTHVVTETCIKCKYTDCVTVCPVDCFHEGENMVVINPETCIDCGVCIPECPIGAIQPDHGPDIEPWVAHNQKYSQLWPNIRVAKAPLPDASQWEKVPNKLRDHFSDKPGH